MKSSSIVVVGDKRGGKGVGAASGNDGGAVVVDV